MAGKSMTRGGDAICATWTRKPADAANLPAVDVKDNGNGCYDITCRPPCAGKYAVEVSINGTMLSHALTITCTDSRWFRFDDVQCQDNNTLSSDKMTVTHTGTYSCLQCWGHEAYDKASTAGEQKWSVAETGMFSLESQRSRNWRSRTTTINRTVGTGTMARRWMLGKSSASIGAFQVGDILRLDLNCDQHTLTITNQRSGETAMIDNLPATELFPYFATHDTDDALSLIW